MNKTKQINDGGPVFPIQSEYPHEVTHGITLRDYFAAAALTGLLADSSNQNVIDNIELAYKYADEMLVERTKK